jgi:LysM repeat protein
MYLHVAVVVLAVASLTLWSCSDDAADPDVSGATGVVTTATPYAVLPAATIVAVQAPPTVPPTPTPRPATTTPTPERVTYRVVAGDNPSSIGARFGVSPNELLRVNNLTNASGLQIGQVLVIPVVATPAATATPTPSATPQSTPVPTVTPSATPTSTATPPPGSQVYMVQSGDTALGIAFQFDVTMAQLAAANNTTEAGLRTIQIGQRLIIPTP